MNILMLNQDWFVPEFRAAGHRVVTCGISKHLDIVLEFPLLHIDSVIAEGFAGQRPDVIVVHDNSAPIVVTGLDETPIPTFFYSVDVQHHVDLHRFLALLFDKTFVAQPDYVPQFHQFGQNPEWMPLWAPQYVEPDPDKRYGAVFIGTLDSTLNPGRVRFFNELRQKTSIHCQQGGYIDFFPRAKIVVNQTVKGDLNFRTFEAMMSGACLLTERRGNGLFELFQEGVHLVSYEPGNADDAAAKIEMLLADRARCRKIAACGRAEILAKHTSAHRAQQVLKAITGLKKRHEPMRFFSSMVNFSTLGVRLEKIDPGLAGSAYVHALKAGEEALSRGEPLHEEAACFIVIAVARYEARLNSGAANEFLRRCSQRYPANATIKLAQIRASLNQGDRSEAERLARELTPADPAITFSKSEEFVGELIAKAAQ